MTSSNSIRTTNLVPTALLRGAVLVAVAAAAFGAGLSSAGGGGVLDARSPRPETPVWRGDAPQGRGAPPPPPIAEDPSSQPLPTEDNPAPLVWEGGGGQGAAAHDLIAVTGSYGVGTSVLYVIDAARKQLAVYEARGGSPGTRRLVLVGARRIDLDLQLEGYRDESEYSYRELLHAFGRRGGDVPADGKGDSTGALTPPAKTAPTEDRR